MFLLWASVNFVVVLGVTSLIDCRVSRLTAVSLDEDVDTDKELVAHGMSNFAAGLLGTAYVLVHHTLRLLALTYQKSELFSLCQYALVGLSLLALPRVY